MRLVRQTRNNNCGQACIAMLAGIPIEAATLIVGKKGYTSSTDLMRALDALHIKHSQLKKFSPSNNIPQTAILIVRSKPRTRVFHFVVWHKGQIFDPSESDDGWISFRRISSFISIDL
jgi:hypothetical protein